jgi:hypothetical protein
MSVPPPPHLTPSALFTDQTKLDRLRLEVYNRILGSAHQKIRFTSQQQNSTQMCYFDVPEWQPGVPRYDVKDCILYIVWNLRHSGFTVVYVPCNRLLINWREHSVKYYQEESPIRQAMMAAATAGAPAVPLGPPPKADKKKAASYKPATEGVAGLLSSGARGGGSKPSNTITFI